MKPFLWTQRQDIGPAPRAGHAMAFDSARRCVVLFGGTADTGQPFGDTWEWDGEYWAQVEDIGPAPRYRHAVAYDAARGRTVLFGGETGQHVGDGTSPQVGGDTWEWDGRLWTQVADTGPAPRSRHALAYDGDRQRLVLFGGAGERETGPLADTWEYDGSDWTQVADTGPTPRHWHCMAFDAVGSRVLLFGGVDGTGARGDTWAWNGSVWEQIADIGPGPCAGGALAFGNGASTLHGGADSLGAGPMPNLRRDTWQRRNSTWTHVQDMGPAPRWDHALAFDTVRNRYTMFGGRSIPPGPTGSPLGAPKTGRCFGDTWESSVIEVPTFTATSVTVEPAVLERAPSQPRNVTVTFSGPAPQNATVTIYLDAAGPHSPAIMATPAVPAGATDVLTTIAPGILASAIVQELTGNTGPGEPAPAMVVFAVTADRIPAKAAPLSWSPSDAAGGYFL